MARAPESAPQTAAALIIGDEILTGKVEEANVAVLARVLFEAGVSLDTVVVCRDREEVIAGELNRLRAGFDLVITSGGVGPTLDDLTLKAVSRAFQRPLERFAELAGLLRRAYGESLTEAHLCMADLPRGAELVTAPESRWPAVKVENVFVLPGLPEVFRHKMPILRRHLAGGTPFLSRALYTLLDEGELAPELERLAARHPRVAFGSYPVWPVETYAVKLTVDGRDEAAVEAALADLAAAVPPEKTVQVPMSKGTQDTGDSRHSDRDM